MRYLIPLGFLLASTTCVAAADFGGPSYDGSLKDAPLAAPAPVWSGLYVGGHVGYGWGEWDGNPCTEGLCAADGWNGRMDPDFDGFLGGIQVGGNRQHGSFVWGLEADVSWGDLSGGKEVFTATNGYSWDDEFSIDAFGTIRGRAGFLLTPNLLLYGTGGLAWAFVSYDHRSYEQSPGPVLTGTGSADETHIGWVAGAGGEYMPASNWTVRAEWLHYDLGDADYTGVGEKTGPLSGPFRSDSIINTDLTFDVFRLGVNYKFGSGQ